MKENNLCNLGIFEKGDVIVLDVNRKFGHAKVRVDFVDTLTDLC